MKRIREIQIKQVWRVCDSTTTTYTAQGACLGEHVSDVPTAEKIAIALLSAEATEVIIAIFLDGTNRIVGFAEVGRGGVAECAAAPATILRPAIVAGARSIFLAHNHPSGSVQPSLADLRVTEALRDACRMLDIRLVDHIVVGDPAVPAHSMLRNGDVTLP